MFTVSNYKADIEWLSAYAEPVYFPSVFCELVLLSRSNHNRKDDDTSKFCREGWFARQMGKINNRVRPTRAMKDTPTNILRMKYSLDLSVVLNGIEKNDNNNNLEYDRYAGNFVASLIGAWNIQITFILVWGPANRGLRSRRMPPSGRRNMRNVFSSRLIQPAGILPPLAPVSFLQFDFYSLSTSEKGSSTTFLLLQKKSYWHAQLGKTRSSFVIECFIHCFVRPLERRMIKVQKINSSISYVSNTSVYVYIKLRAKYRNPFSHNFGANRSELVRTMWICNARHCMNSR